MIDPSFLEQKGIYNGLLLGFSISIAIALIGMRDNRRIVTTCIVVYILAAFLLFVDTYSSVRILLELTRHPDPLPADVAARIEAALAMSENFDTLGFFSLIVALGLSGWIHSRFLGVLTTIGMSLTFVFVFRFVSALVL